MFSNEKQRYGAKVFFSCNTDPKYSDDQIIYSFTLPDGCTELVNSEISLSKTIKTGYKDIPLSGDIFNGWIHTRLGSHIDKNGLSLVYKNGKIVFIYNAEFKEAIYKMIELLHKDGCSMSIVYVECNRYMKMVSMRPGSATTLTFILPHDSSLVGCIPTQWTLERKRIILQVQ